MSISSSGAGIDECSAANTVKNRERAIGIDIRNEMTQRARENAQNDCYRLALPYSFWPLYLGPP